MNKKAEPMLWTMGILFFSAWGCVEAVFLGMSLDATGPENRAYTLWLFNIAMENGPFIDDFPLKPLFIVDFPWLC